MTCRAVVVLAAAAGSGAKLLPIRHRRSGSLSDVVGNAVKRWYYEAAEEGYKGDVKMQALLGNMLVEG